MNRKFFFIILILVFTLPVCGEEDSAKTPPFMITADYEIFFDTQQKILTALGNACFEMEDIVVNADKIRVFSNENLILAEGAGLSIKIEEQTFEGTILNFNYQDMTGSIQDVYSRIRDISLSGARISLVKIGNYEIDEVQLTPCIFTDPHYSIIAKKIIVYPEDRIIARKVWFCFAGFKLFYLPSYTIKYAQDTGNYGNVSLVPELGYKDGIYLKVVYPYEISSDFSGEIQGEINQRGDKFFTMDNVYNLTEKLAILNSYLYEYIEEDNGNIQKKNEMKIGLNYYYGRGDIYTGLKRDFFSESNFYEIDGRFRDKGITLKYYNEFKDNSEINKENYSIKYNLKYPVELLYKKGYKVDYLPYLKISGLDYNFNGLNIRSVLGIGKSANKDIVSNKAELNINMSKDIISNTKFNLKADSLFKINYYQSVIDDNNMYNYYRIGFNSTYHNKLSEDIQYKLQLGYNQRQDAGFAYLPEDKIESSKNLNASIGLRYLIPEEFSAWHLHLDTSYELSKQKLEKLNLVLNRELDCYDYYIGLDFLEKKLEFGINL